MVVEKNKTHPRRHNNKNEVTKFPICCGKGSSTGSLSSTDNLLSKDFEDEMGVGISIYFQTLKSLGCLFLVFSILSLPILLVCAGSGINHELETDSALSVIKNSESWLTIMTLGNLGEK